MKQESEYTMRKMQVIETEIEEFVDWDWLFVPETKDNDTQSAREDYEYAAKVFKVPAPFVQAVDEALRQMANEISKAAKSDMTGIVKMIPE